MRQRLGLATALLHGPQVLVLDEPANGLDPEGVRWLRELLRNLAADGVTVLVSSHIIAEVSLAIPNMILAETALSFLGLGLQPPIVSWGVLLQEAQNIRAIATAPWLFCPGIAVIVAVLALNFVGDGLRDAADPYRQ